MNILTKLSSLNNPLDQEYKLIEVEYNIESINQNQNNTRPMNFTMRIKPLKTIILFLIILTVFIFIYYPKGNLFKSLFIDKAATYRYSIIIDAGSTGSRIHVFRLRKNEGGVTMPYSLVNEDLFHSIKPGLSSYAEEPHKAANSLKPLLDMAVSKIPPSLHGKTRISLKATAGLRLISESRANQILKSVENLFSNYPFYKTSNDVSVLDGTYEGIYSWLTLNYARNSFHEKKEAETCALDLGGGSTQVTFIPTDHTAIATMKPQNIIDFKLDKILYKIYTESFLGYGVMSARLSIFETEKKHFQNETTTLSVADDDKNTLLSACVKSTTSINWVQQNVRYTVKGIPGKERNFVDCLSRIEKLFDKNKLNAPIELRNKQIYAFSFYYDRISSAKLVGVDGGQIKIEDLFIRAKEVCDNKHQVDSETKDIEFFCMDLTYIYALLTHGLGLNLNQIINVYKEINSMEISWALGAAFHMLNDN